jgi:hypothetical protein
MAAVSMRTTMPVRGNHQKVTIKSDYEVGYGKPPEATQFKRSTSANPKGRPKRKPGIVGDVIKDVLKASVEYREGGQTERRLVETSPSLQSVAGEFYG